ncbi:hypothetical protein J14TS5_47910 [Paenibacillus lautus]|nr:hypothetical protein J14TS5_47910 [Paenibacillus lautus]
MIRKISIKFIIGFSLIFSLSFIVLNQTVKEFIRAFLINHFSNNKASALFSYPVVIDGAKVGIFRFVKDFSLLYAQAKLSSFEIAKNQRCAGLNLALA